MANPKGPGIVDGTEAADIIDTAYDEAGADSVTSGADVINAAGGHDEVSADDGADLIYGGRGDDTLNGEDGNDTIYGDTAGDTNAGNGEDLIDGGDGEDLIFGEGGSDTIDGGIGDDTIHGGFPEAGTSTGRESFNWSELENSGSGGGPAGIVSDGDDLDTVLTQDTGSVTVTFRELASSGAETEFETDDQNISGIDAGGEIINDNSAMQSSTSSSGENAYYSLGFSDPVANVDFRINDIDFDSNVQVLAFDENDNPIEVVLTASSGTALSLSDEDGVAGNETAAATGNSGTETDDDNSILVEIAGPVARIKIIHANDGGDYSDINVTDVFFDTLANDLVDDSGDDLSGGEGDDLIYGNGGDDTIDGGDGNDTVDGGDGNDLINTGGNTEYALPDLGFPGYGIIPSIPMDQLPENDLDLVYGGDGNDTISTGDDADTIFGGEGDDSIDGGIDADHIEGGAGEDYIVGGEGSDTILAGDNDDVVYGGLDPIYPDALNIRDDATPPDPVVNNGQDYIDGGDGNDTLFGQDDDDTILGGLGDDVIDGGIDEDDIDGGEGDDTIEGGHGDDTLSGGTGEDSLTGGIGNDDFDLNGDDDADYAAGGDDEDSFVGIGQGDTVDGNEGGSDFDTLDLGGAAEAANPGGSLTVTYDSSNTENGVVSFFDSSGTQTGTAEFFNIENVICFTPDTGILTPTGEIAVQDLKIGDRVVTRDNGLQTIRWIGRKRLQGRQLLAMPHLRPVMIRKHSLGHNVPERDMMVSPSHRMLLVNSQSELLFDEREVLAAAKHLTHMDGVKQLDTVGVEYIHFLCDNHEVVLASGAWSETFQPGEYSMGGMESEQRNEILELFPELHSHEGLNEFHAARTTLKRHEAKLLG